MIADKHADVVGLMEDHSYKAQRVLTDYIALEKTSYGSVVVPDVLGYEKSSKLCYCLPRWVGAEFKTLFNLAWTMVLTTIMTNILAPIGLMFAGHLGIQELGGVALGNTVINLFGNAIGIGLSTACDTFFAQTYGSGHKKKVGVHLQRGCYVIILFAFPCWMILLNTESILVALGQDPVISNISADYILHYMPVIPVIFLYNIFSKYLRNQNIIWPTLASSALGVAACALSAYLLVSVWDLRVHGCAYAQFIGFCVMTGGNVGYSILSPRCSQCWDGFSWDALQDWGQFTSLAVYGMFLVLEQMGAFEVGTILAGLLGPVELGAQTILFQIETITFMVPIGVGIACNIRIGHILGANDPVQARRSVYVGYAIIWTATLIVACLLASLRYYIPQIFTNDKDVIELSATLLLIMALYAVFEGTVGTSSGMLRGCGRQRVAAAITFTGFYVIGLPIGIALMFFTDLRTAGFWWGLLCGIVTQAVVYTFVLMCCDWEKQAARAQALVGAKTKADGVTHGEDSETDDDEQAPLVKLPFKTGGRRRLSSTKSEPKHEQLYCGEFVSSQVLSTAHISVLGEVNPLSKRELICRRGLTLVLCVLMLVVGLSVRFLFPPAGIVPTPNNTTVLSYETFT